jgi:hypothetical protein
MILRSAPRPSRYAGIKAALFRAALACGTSGALTAVTSAAAAAPAEASAEVLLLIEGDPADLEPERVRDAIAREIGAPVVLAIEAVPGRAVLILRMKPGREVDLTYRDRAGGVIERGVDLPWESDRAVDTVALLAGNLVRDEAAEIAASLKKREPAAAPAATAPPATPPRATPPRAAPPRAAPGPARPKRPEATPPPPAKPASCSSSHYPTVIAGVGYDPFGLLTGNLSFDHSVRHLSFNATVGRTAGLRGLEIGVLGNYEREFACGVQIANVANVVSGPMRGVQAAGVLNVASEIEGVQMATILNVSSGAARGAQLAGVNVHWGGRFRGVQGGIVNVSQEFSGVQLAGINIDRKGPTRGVQGSAVLNVGADVAGLQLGTINIAGGSVSGVQAGVVNYSRKEVRGIQIGAVNVAESSDFSLGLFNYMSRGRHHIDVWGHESGLMAAAYKNGGKYFHYLYGAGGRPVGQRPQGGAVWGLGGHIPFAQSVYTDVDALGYSLWAHGGAMTTLAELRVVVGLRLVRWFALYGGPSYTVSIAVTGKAADFGLFGSQLLSEPGDPELRGWPGAVLGVQFL